MLSIATGNLLQADVDALVNTVNTVGVSAPVVSPARKRCSRTGPVHVAQTALRERGLT